ncbi:MAG: DUF4376 domain-containing protein [Geobacteraceae bacterium]|nr:DUF4376 domain-containing protein [Geobacteraceae bacterium]
MQYIVYNTESGKIKGWYSVEEDQISSQCETSESYLAVEEYNPTATHFLSGRLITINEVKTVDEIRQIKLNALAEYRYEREIGGVTINDLVISTDRESQSLLTSACLTVQMTPAAIINWKSPTGWVKLNKTAIELIALAVSTHVQACFTVEESHDSAIKKLTTVDQINNYDVTIGWPVN